MIIYFTDRKFNILGHTSTELPEGLTITEDLKTEDIETGVAVFECKMPYSADTMEKAEACSEVGNYLLRSHNGETEFYTIIEQEKDTKHQEIYLYAEDAGLDLLNEIVGAYEADKAYPVTHYVDRFAKDSGFVIGTNEIKSLTRKLKWDGESTAAERLASVATQFDNAEISYSFDIKGLLITNKYINIYKKRGKDIGVQLRLNKEIDSIVTKKTIANLATSLLVTGGTPENSENPITLNGYKYDDGDFYVSGDRLNSRKALKKWSRYVWNNEPNKINGYTGHIIRTFSYDTTSQKELCTRAVTELKKLCEIEVNYEVDITYLPDNVKIGDRVNIVDDEGSLYLSTRLLKLETSVADKEKKATLGEHLLKGSGIHQKVADLAKEFSENSLSAKRAIDLANKAKAQADAAKTEAESALQESGAAKTQADTAKQAAAAAEQSSQAAVEAAQADVDNLEIRTTTAETKIKQNSDAIELAATKEEVTKKLSGYYTKTETDAKLKVESDRITSTVEKVATVENKVNNIKVGGRNLILNSAENVVNSDYMIHRYTMSEKMIKGVMYTLCIWGELGTGKASFSAYLDGGNLFLAKLTDNNDGTYSATFAGKTGTLETSEIHVYVPSVTVSVPSTIAKAKLEKGNKATDWTPANEDVVTVDELTDFTEAINSEITTARTEIEQLSDSISMLVTDSDGSSLMEQTSDGWTFNIGAITDTLDDAKKRLEDVSGSVAGAEDTLQKLDSLVDDISKKTAYIVIATDDSGNPCIELGRAGNPFKVRITNTSVDFMEASEKIAYISNKALYIEKAIIKDELQIGEYTGFIWKRRNNGNMGLRWAGDK